MGTDTQKKEKKKKKKEKYIPKTYNIERDLQSMRQDKGEVEGDGSWELEGSYKW